LILSLSIEVLTEYEHCEEIIHKSMFGGCPKKCPARSHLKINGRAVCDGHVGRVLRELAQPVDIGGGI